MIFLLQTCVLNFFGRIEGSSAECNACADMGARTPHRCPRKFWLFFINISFDTVSLSVGINSLEDKSFSGLS